MESLRRRVTKYPALQRGERHHPSADRARLRIYQGKGYKKGQQLMGSGRQTRIVGFRLDVPGQVREVIAMDQRLLLAMWGMIHRLRGRHVDWQVVVKNMKLTIDMARVPPEGDDPHWCKPSRPLVRPIAILARRAKASAVPAQPRDREAGISSP